MWRGIAAEGSTRARAATLISARPFRSPGLAPIARASSARASFFGALIRAGGAYARLDFVWWQPAPK